MKEELKKKLKFMLMNNQFNNNSCNKLIYHYEKNYILIINIRANENIKKTILKKKSDLEEIRLRKIE